MSGTNDENPPPPPPQEKQQTPTQQTPQTVSTIKLPILKKGEYDIWAMKIEHYLAHTDYPIWEVIQNGNGPVEDLDAVYQLVMDKYQDEMPEGVHTLMTEEGLVIHMLKEKKYPLKKEIVVQMLKLKLESEEESTMALELMRFIKKILADLESKE
ncbi:hypothetical protein Tco_0144875 [Tanacetum coccineum]